MNASLFKIKIMPTSPEVNLEAIKKSAEKIIKKEKGKNIEFEEEPIAFGLNAVIVSFEISEEQEMNSIENSLEEIEEVSSVRVVDMRRAFG